MFCGWGNKKVNRTGYPYPSTRTTKGNRQHKVLASIQHHKNSYISSRNENDADLFNNSSKVPYSHLLHNSINLYLGIFPRKMKIYVRLES